MRKELREWVIMYCKLHNMKIGHKMSLADDKKYRKKYIGKQDALEWIHLNIREYVYSDSITKAFNWLNIFEDDE